MPVRVVIVDDHRMLVDALTDHLAGEDGIEVVGRYQTLAGVLEELEEVGPDVVLLDHRLPDGDGASSTRAIVERRAGTSVVLMSAAEGGQVLADALDAGVAGFVHKSRGAEAVVDGLRRVADGGTAFEPDDLQDAWRRIHDRRQFQELTERELEVLALLAQGLGPQAIAERLVLSPHTVRNHVRHVLDKLDAHSQLEAVAAGLRLGLVDPPGGDTG